MSVLNRSTVNHYVWGEACDGWRLIDEPDLSVIEERMPPGSAETRHLHGKARQLFYVLEGTLTLEVGGRRDDLSAGEAGHVAPGQAHQVRNAGQDPVRFLVVSAPTTRGDRHSV